MQSEIMQRGLELLAYGMTTVVLFLVLLIAVMQLMSWLIVRFYPGTEPGLRPSSPAPAAQRRTTGAPQLEGQALAAVIAAAIHQHRQEQ